MSVTERDDGLTVELDLDEAWVVLSLEPKFEGSRPEPMPSGGTDERRTWSCTVRCTGGGHEAVTVFPYFTGSQGGDPTVARILWCVLSECSMLDDEADLDEVLSGISYTEARRMEQGMRENRDRLLLLLGPFYDEVVGLGSEVWDR